MCVCFDGRFARPEQANGPTGRGRRMERRDRFAPQNRPERNPAERPGRDVLARRANRGPGCDAAVRPHGRMRDGPKGRSPLRHAKPSRGGRKAEAKVDVQATTLATIQSIYSSMRHDGPKSGLSRRHISCRFNDVIAPTRTGSDACRSLDTNTATLFLCSRFYVEILNRHVSE